MKRMIFGATLLLLLLAAACSGAQEQEIDRSVLESPVSQEQEAAVFSTEPGEVVSSALPSPSSTPELSENVSVIEAEILAMAVPNYQEAFDESDLTAGDLKYGDTIRQVEKALGKPSKKDSGSDDLRGIDYIGYYYANGDKYTFGSYGENGSMILCGALIQSGETEGPRGIRVGDSMRSVIETFYVAPRDVVEQDVNDEWSDRWVVFYDTHYVWIDGSGEIEHMWRDPDGSLEALEGEGRYNLNYRFPFSPYTYVDLVERNAPYYLHGILDILCEDGVVVEIEWWTYAAE